DRAGVELVVEGRGKEWLGQHQIVAVQPLPELGDAQRVGVGQFDPPGVAVAAPPSAAGLPGQGTEPGGVVGWECRDVRRAVGTAYGAGGLGVLPPRGGYVDPPSLEQ